MNALLDFILYVISLYKWVIIGSIILSWLIAFNVINQYNPFVRTLWTAFDRLTEPALAPIRRLMPDLGGIDISPIILFLIFQFIETVVIGHRLEPGFLRQLLT